jgi:membrane protein DedA with SNARE-associated domain
VTEQLIEHFTYLGIVVALLGLPIPEEGAIITSGVLAHEGVVRWWIALPLCLVAVVAADVILYVAGHRWGRKVLRWRMGRWLLPPARLAVLERRYHDHGVKIVFAARHVFGLRVAAFLIAGVVRVPFPRFVAVDSAGATRARSTRIAASCAGT